MTDEEYRHVFVKKLQYYMNLHGKNQMDLMKDLGLGSSTVSSWCTGQKLPRMGKIQMLADYFGIRKSDLLEENPDFTSRIPEFITTEKERTTIRKYRTLDEYGKKNVDTILDNEYTRCNPKPAPAPIRLEDSRPAVSPNLRAAHNDNTEPDQLEKMQRDLDWLSKQ